MVNNKEKFYGLLGLASRARKLISGEELVIQEVRKGKAKCVILASDASEGTKKKITDKCRYYHVPMIQADERAQLGAAIGKEQRVVVAICDSGFAKKIMSYIN